MGPSIRVNLNSLKLSWLGFILRQRVIRSLIFFDDLLRLCLVFCLCISASRKVMLVYLTYRRKIKQLSLWIQFFVLKFFKFVFYLSLLFLAATLRWIFLNLIENRDAKRIVQFFDKTFVQQNIISRRLLLLYLFLLFCLFDDTDTWILSLTNKVIKLCFEFLSLIVWEFILKITVILNLLRNWYTCKIFKRSILFHEQRRLIQKWPTGTLWRNVGIYSLLNEMGELVLKHRCSNWLCINHYWLMQFLLPGFLFYFVERYASFNTDFIYKFSLEFFLGWHTFMKILSLHW